ncbi:hypothetical protein CBL_20716 [Carabus blaptoides fortunei]
MAYRSTIHALTDETPFFLIHGRDIALPFEKILKPCKVRYDYDENYSSDLLARLNSTFKTVREHLQKSSNQRQKHYNRKSKPVEIQVGDRVYLHNTATKVGISKKLSEEWNGPYRIKEQLRPVTFRITDMETKKEQIVHANRLKGCCERDPEPVESSSTEDSEVEDEQKEIDDEENSPLFPNENLDANNGNITDDTPEPRNAEDEEVPEPNVDNGITEESRGLTPPRYHTRSRRPVTEILNLPKRY